MLFSLLAESAVNLGVKLACGDPHGVVITFIKSADEVDILRIDRLRTQHISHFLHRCNCLSLDHRVVRTRDHFKWPKQISAILSFLVFVLSKVISECAQLLSQGHHELWVTVDFIDQLGEHGDQFFDTSFGAEKVSNLIEPLDTMHFSVWILTREVINKQCHCRDGVNLIKFTAIRHGCVIGGGLVGC